MLGLSDALIAHIYVCVNGFLGNVHTHMADLVTYLNDRQNKRIKPR